MGPGSECVPVSAGVLEGEKQVLGQLSLQVWTEFVLV